MKKLEQVIKTFLKDLSLLKVSRFLFYVFIFILPFQINVLIHASAVFESGNFNPYTSVFIYLTDFLFLGAFILWVISIWTNKFKHKLTYGNALIVVLLFLFLILGEVSVLFATDKWLAFNILIRFVELVLMYFFVVNKVVKLDTIINVFIVTISLQAFFAILQYISQGAIGLHFLGEPNISAEAYGIAKMNLENEVLIRPYGTFLHPNVLSGFLIVAILFAYLRVRQKKAIAYPLLFILLTALLLTFSRSAFLALLMAGFVFISLKENKISFKYLFLFLSGIVFLVVVFNLEQTIFQRLLFTDFSSISERVYYFNISKRMMLAEPFGVGLGNYTLAMPDYTSLKLAPWDFQPVHNILMLIANEMGIIACAVFSALILSFAVLLFMKFIKIKGKLKETGIILLCVLTGLVVVGLFDHYLMSLYQGQVLLFLIFAMSGQYLTLKNH